ncbi:hypothetical protein CR970_00970 [Candidatus Saccharibacteria bacterium]|nr:MAG: hypothetical protein CR970_00970 [Candidatus Saccharibacteria bacterium]
MIRDIATRFTRLAAIAVLAGSILASYGTPAETADALAGNQFSAGRIIDDSLFFNGYEFSVESTQQFLNSKVPVCDTDGTQPYAGTTTGQYGTNRGYPPPYTCLKDLRQTTVEKPADNFCNGYPAAEQSAAEIIVGVGRSCGVNPKALIVLLQKEQGLVTDTWPWPTQYAKATGYACPDTAACDTHYAGFFNQVYSAARQFKRYAAYPESYNHLAGRNNNVLYSPSHSCGSSTVFIENQATAGLYNYTPYQPNQAALNNLYGTGDNCSAYGNRNFWRYYNDWFGSTSGPAFMAKYVAQSSYPIVDSGTTRTIYFEFKNSGRMFWKDDQSTFPGYLPVHLAATSPINRASKFYHNSWLSQSRPCGTFSAVYEADGTTLAANQHTVEPGQIARFEFTISTDPSTDPGIYREYFQPVLEGAPNPSWSMGAWAYLDIGVHRPTYKAAYHSQSGYPALPPNGEALSFIRYKNTGQDSWYDTSVVWPGKSPIVLSTAGPINRASTFGSLWTKANRPAVTFSKVYEADGSTLAANQHVVKPGQIGEFAFTLKAGTETGISKEYFQLIAEGAINPSWNIENSTSWLQVTVE